jgi:Mg2+ and Co2+ transporter CorA
VEQFFELPLEKFAQDDWLWIDEVVPHAELLAGVHSPHEYSGYDLHVRKQPVMAQFVHHDHLIIPDLDCETEGEQTISLIVYPDFIWTRRSQAIKGFDGLLDSTDFKTHAIQHKTTAYVFVGILRVMLNSLNQQLLRNERQTYALEDTFLQRKQGHRPSFETSHPKSEPAVDDPLANLMHLSNAKKLAELRIHVAWLRKQFDAFERVAATLLDPTQGSFHQLQRDLLQQEAMPYFQHLADQIQRALTKIQHLRDIHLSLEQWLASQQVEKTNQTLLRLTWVSVIFLPAVVIAGIFGMNVSLFTDPHHIWSADSQIAFALLIIGR